MISFHKIIFGVILGSSLLIFIAFQLFSPSEQVQASTISADQPTVILENEKPVMLESCQISQKYPESIQQWCSSIQTNASKYSIDPNLLAAVMLQESGGDPNAFSSSGAVGLMQIMPRDGIAAGFTCINGPCFANRPTIDELYDPEFNLDFGSRMLVQLFEKHGNWRDALKSYGPMDMDYRYADIVLGIYHNYQ